VIGKGILVTTFQFNEEYLSQIPALQQLINLGYNYLTPAQALAARQGKRSNVLLEEILRSQLKAINRIQYRGQEYLFSEENIQVAIQKLKNIRWDGLHKTSEAAYDLLSLGTSLEQAIERGARSFTLHYIDWKNPVNNAFHVTAEFAVEKMRSAETVRPDIVLFVNGIPLSVLECKSPQVDLEQAVSHCIRNQQDDSIPGLFIYVQLLLAINKNAALYATTGTPRKFWSAWQEMRYKTEGVQSSLSSLSPEDKAALFSRQFTAAKAFFDDLENSGSREITEQDRAVYALCSPERLLDMAFRFITFDSGVKKIARYQQYFVVKSTLERVKQFESVFSKTKRPRRKGGIIWHTQGSGKSLTMVWLARNLALDPEIPNPRIVLVTDRVDLDEQLGNTFAACGLRPKRARTGSDLLNLASGSKAAIITTVIHKFTNALKKRKFHEPSENIFILIDESHRTNFGFLAARMRQMFPNACYLGFTGTPLTKSEKNNFAKFGGLIEPRYPIRQAIRDKQVLPLLYEGRHVELIQNRNAIDIWFDRQTQYLTDKQKSDLKKKYARAEMLNKSDRIIYLQAFDISEHYRTNWKNSSPPAKAQLVAPDKKTAIKFHEYLNEFGHVASEVIISPPDVREGYEDVKSESSDDVVRFWKKMINRYGSEKEYNKQIISYFKYRPEPEVIIVVDKLITGFDAPPNTVMYLCRKLREHTLLQAIARVNRLNQGKEFGYIIDYAGILGELDQALTMYNDAGLEGFDEEDLEGTLMSIDEQIARLPQAHSDLWEIFKEVRNRYDEEAYELLLGDDFLREEFYERLAHYSRLLAIAFSSERFIMEIPDLKLMQYKNDLKRFHNLKAAVKLRYAEVIDCRDYEPRIKKLLDTYIDADEIIRLNDPINIFDDLKIQMVKEGKDASTGSKADAIAHAIKKVISEKMQEDPAFYEKFSNLIQQAINDFRSGRISDLVYLSKAMEIRRKVVTRDHDDTPTELADDEHAQAFYGIIKSFFDRMGIEEEKGVDISVDFAAAIVDIFKRNWKVQFWDDEDAQKQVQNAIDDFLYDEIKRNSGISLNAVQMDDIIANIMHLARNRMPS
jgi:type I restriction enzyme R subunit